MSRVFIIPITIREDKCVVSGMIAFAHDACSTKGSEWSVAGCELVVDEADMVTIGTFNFHTYGPNTPRHLVRAQSDPFFQRAVAQAEEVLGFARELKWRTSKGIRQLPVACYPHLVQLLREQCFAWQAREALEEVAARG